MRDKTFKKNSKINLLKVKTAKAIQSYKSTLASEGKNNKHFASNFKVVSLLSSLNSGVFFSIIVKILFPKNDRILEDFLLNLRFRGVTYLMLQGASLSTSDTTTASYKWLANEASGGLLLTINTSSESEYRTLVHAVLQLERQTLEYTFNRIQLLCVKEGSHFISFGLGDLEIRKLYDLKVTKEAILLETLNTLDYPALSIRNAVGNEVSALTLAHSHTFFLSFPFKN